MRAPQLPAAAAPRLPLKPLNIAARLPRQPFAACLPKAQAALPPPSPLVPGKSAPVVATAPALAVSTATSTPPPAARPRPVEREQLDLDPSARTLAQLAPPMPVAPATPAPVQPSGTTAIDPNLAAELVERAAFWGDGARGLARLRFGSKARAGLAGGTVTLEHDGDVLRLRVEDVDDASLSRLRERLAARGIEVEE